jgi:glutaredoxin 3
MSAITIYTTPTCGFCQMAKQYLGSKEIEFETKDITTDSDAYDEILEKSNQLGVPVLDVDGTIIVGFDRNKLDAVLRDKKLM